MNWITFLSYTSMGYAAYYLIIVLLESRRTPGPDDEKNLETFSFSKTVEAEKVSLEDYEHIDAQPAPFTATEPVSSGLGGVSLKGLFDLARIDAIEYTKAVSF
jgi:hypothetical protein